MKYIKIKNIKEVDSEPVYHMTVEKNHNFFANKMCVHNCDYRGEVKIILINHGKHVFEIGFGDRIAQGVINSVISKTMTTFNKVDTLEDNTERGSGGFGSTGIK
jgi:deoxyuridine 5'-triphosphate nucleotidohydrolase